MSNPSLIELQEINKVLSIAVKDLYQRLKSEKLEACYYKFGKLYLIVGFKEMTFDEYVKKENLTDNQIKLVKNQIDNYIKKTKRLQEIQKKIFKLIYGNAKPIKENKKGDLQVFISERAEQYNLTLGETVPVRTVDLILKEAQKKKLTDSNSLESIRKALGRLGYSSEREFFNRNKKTKDRFPKAIQIPSYE